MQKFCSYNLAQWLYGEPKGTGAELEYRNYLFTRLYFILYIFLNIIKVSVCIGDLTNSRSHKYVHLTPTPSDGVIGAVRLITVNLPPVSSCDSCFPFPPLQSVLFQEHR